MQTKNCQKITENYKVRTPGTRAFWMYGEIQSAFLALDSFSEVCEGQTDREWFRFDQDIQHYLLLLISGNGQQGLRVIQNGKGGRRQRGESKKGKGG